MNAVQNDTRVSFNKNEFITNDKDVKLSALVDCNSVDRDPACGSLQAHQCYESSQICCQSCKRFNVAHLYGEISFIQFRIVNSL